jgi:hypothetical protein
MAENYFFALASRCRSCREDRELFAVLAVVKRISGGRKSKPAINIR